MCPKNVKPNAKKNHLAAFTLTELLVVLVIIGILVLIALPNFTGVVGQAHTQEAKIQLRQIHQLQKSYFLANTKYTLHLHELHFIQEKLQTEGGTAKYVITVTDAGPNGYTAEARAIADFDQDGVFNVWQINQNMELTETVPD